MSTVTTRSSRSFRVGRMMIMRRRVSPKIRLKVSSPLKVVAKIHDAYVEMMMRLANSVGNMYAIGGFGNRKRIPKPQNQVPLGGEQIDAKLVLEIYNKLAASKNSSNANINLWWCIFSFDCEIRLLFFFIGLSFNIPTRRNGFVRSFIYTHTKRKDSLGNEKAKSISSILWYALLSYQRKLFIYITARTFCLFGWPKSSKETFKNLLKKKIIRS